MAQEPTAAELAEYVDLKTEKSDLDSRSRTIDKRLKSLAGRFREFLGDRTSARRLGFLLAVVPGNKYPKWKEEVISRFGEEAASEIEDSTPRSMSLIVTQETQHA